MTEYQVECPKCGDKDTVMVEGRLIFAGKCKCGAKRQVVASNYMPTEAYLDEEE